MDINKYNDPKNSLVLFGLDKDLNFFKKLHDIDKIPKVLMLSGKKGIGKFTLINHFLFYIFDKDSYDSKNKSINKESKFYKQYFNNVLENIIYLSGSNFKNVRIDDIRALKTNILKTSISNKKRFIILDDVELFNNNSLNALLKLIEEPSSKNYFILINNQTKPLIKTIYSRSLEIKILLNNQSRVEIIEKLIERYDLQPLFDYNDIDITPGSFLLFNNICEDNKIDLNSNLLKNLELLLNLYKKHKSSYYENMIYFLIDYYFYKLKKKKLSNIQKFYDIKSFLVSNINKFFTYNLNQKSLINVISNTLPNE